MNNKNEDSNAVNEFSIIKRFNLASTVLWLFALYLPSVFLSIMFGIYTTTVPSITDANAWFADGDIISIFSILMALLTLPVVAFALRQMPVRQRYDFLRLSTNFCWNDFKPWGLLTLVYITFWWVFNAVFAIEIPQLMLDLLATTDHVWLLFIAIYCYLLQFVSLRQLSKKLYFVVFCFLDCSILFSAKVGRCWQPVLFLP